MKSEKSTVLAAERQFKQQPRVFKICGWNFPEAPLQAVNLLESTANSFLITDRRILSLSLVSRCQGAIKTILKR